MLVHAPVQLGRLLLPSRLLLAPLESVSDNAFRKLCWDNGAVLTFPEMIRAQALAKNNKATLDLLDTFHESVTGVQLLVSSKNSMSSALERLEQLAFSSHPHFRNIRVVDLNFGCPSKEIIATGCGPAMLKRRSKISEIFQSIAQWKAHTKLNISAVGAKIRLGLNAYEQQQKVFHRCLYAMF